MDGNCHYSEKDCWNIHDPAKKGQKLEESNETERQSVFQDGQEQHGLPPGQKKAAHRMNCEGWEEYSSRKKNGKKRVSPLGKDKETQGQGSKQKKDGEATVTSPLDGRVNHVTPSILQAGEQTQQTDAGKAPAASRGRTVKRKVRRGGGEAGAATASLIILNKNVCGWTCKKANLETILDKLDPDICTWQETGLTGNNQIRIKG